MGKKDSDNILLEKFKQLIKSFVFKPKAVGFNVSGQQLLP